jgi:putative transposase
MISALDREKAVMLIKEAVENGARLVKACSEIGISTRTFNRWRDNCYIDKRTSCNRPEPANKLSVEEEQEILKIINKEEFASLPPSQIVPALADRGIYIASESTFYRVMGKHDEQHHRGRSKEPIKRPIATHKATAPNQVYMWDITYLNGFIKGVHYYLYMISDLFSRKIVGWEVWEEESAEHASELIRKTVISEKIALRDYPLVLHSDNGSPMKGATMLETLYNLGIIPSRSRPRVSNDNPYAESLFKTMKYRPNYQPKGFESLDEARQWVKWFVNWYNNDHKHSGINFVSPNQQHTGKSKEILDKRHEVYESAKKLHPERWTRATRDWSQVDEVWLNPEKLDGNVDKCIGASKAS